MLSILAWALNVSFVSCRARTLTTIQISLHPVIAEIEKISGKKYNHTFPEGDNGEGINEEQKVDIAMRVVADHLRAVAFSIADGQLPSNAKAGYVIRRILRRAVRYAYTFLGQKEAFMYKLLNVLVREMGTAYPELTAQRELIGRVMKEEEDSFLRTLEKGIMLLNGAMDELKAHGQTQLDGKELSASSTPTVSHSTSPNLSAQRTDIPLTRSSSTRRWNSRSTCPQCCRCREWRLGSIT